MARKRKPGPQQPDLFSSLEPPPPEAAHGLDARGTLGPAAAPRAGTPVPAALPKFQHLAQIAVEGPVRGLFTYIADEFWEQLAPGTRVQVPWGRGKFTGFFIGEKTLQELAREGKALDPAKLRPILCVLDTAKHLAVPTTGADQARANSEAKVALVTPQLLALAKWMACHYVAPMGTVLAKMLPAGAKRASSAARKRMVEAAVPPAELLGRAAELKEKKPQQANVLNALSLESGPQWATQLLAKAQANDSALKALEKAGLIRVTKERPQAACAEADMAGESAAGLKLTVEQQEALQEIEQALRRAVGEPHGPPPNSLPQGEGDTGEDARATGFLLHGVTGSGKTEVYIRALQTALALGRQGIVLVPEIALTPQTAQRFEQRLGRARLAVLHSHVTDGERAEAWRAVRNGKIDVVVGTESAIFAPLPRLGLIVVDEEHDSSFKSLSRPRYHARDVAMELARLCNAVLILGTATPSLESLYAAHTGRLTRLVLSRRVAGRPLPPVEIVDMNRENQEVKRYSYLSRRLVRALDETLGKGEQAILFMNRRGFATVITCVHCGYTERCEQCDITLTSHRQPATGGGDKGHGEVLTCHHCGLVKPVPTACGNCGAPGLKHWGMGTERVEAEVRRTFSNARVARMDSDKMKGRASYLEALGNFRAGKTNVLVGTQMIAKGLDFPNVTLVGVVLADTALHMPDFRSRERTFQLLAQVAGRAGRSEKGGRVIIQTHLPNDPAIRAAVEHDFEAFSLHELQERRAYGYPPFTRLARILIRGKDCLATQQAAQAAAEALRANCGTDFQPVAHGQDARGAVEHGQDARGTITILGPAEAPIAKLEGRFRQHILLKAASSEALSALLAGPAGDAIGKLKGAEAVVDVDPLAML